MNELNLEVGQRKWTIQLGYCYVDSIDYNLMFPICFRTKDGRTCTYTSLGQATTNDLYSSVFESNPFESKKKHFDFIPLEEPKENKAELINALCAVLNCSATKLSQGIAQEKLQKLLESL